MQVFEIRDKKIEVTEHALLVPVFKKIWESDKSKEKTRAIRDLSYVEFMCNPRRSNPYYGRPQNERRIQLNIDLYHDENYEISDDVKKAIWWYRATLQAALPSLKMYNNVASAVDSLSEYFGDVTYSGEEGMKQDPKKVSDMIIKSKELLARLEELREAVESEIFEITSHRGGRTVNPFERRPDEK
jgi:hypothetical protein